jgi:hypothetical protein
MKNFRCAARALFVTAGPKTCFSPINGQFGPRYGQIAVLERRSRVGNTTYQGSERQAKLGVIRN